MAIAESNIKELQNEFGKRDDIPLYFADSFDIQRPKANFVEYRSSFKQGFLDIDYKSSNYTAQTQDSCTLYLEFL